MGALLLNPNEVAHLEPLRVRELQHRCVQCANREQCALDLADKFSDPDWQCWCDYCPNAATLTTLTALQSCSTASGGFAAAPSDIGIPAAH